MIQYFETFIHCAFTLNTIISTTEPSAQTTDQILFPDKNRYPMTAPKILSNEVKGIKTEIFSCVYALKYKGLASTDKSFAKKVRKNR